jgi:hypothetical protein
MNAPAVINCGSVGLCDDEVVPAIGDHPSRQRYGRQHLFALSARRWPSKRELPDRRW